VEPGGSGPGRLNAAGTRVPAPDRRAPADEADAGGAHRKPPCHLDRLGFQPVEDAGIEGPASDQEPSDDDCTTRPEKVAELIAAEGTA
jgi:hypothetical protein